MMWPRGPGASGSQEHTRRRGPAFQTEAGKDDWAASCWLAGNRRDARNGSGIMVHSQAGSGCRVSGPQTCTSHLRNKIEFTAPGT
ncbi:hypothetical protein NN561_004586 [Cricetulus griseus]